MRAERNGFSKGTPAKMMSRSIDMSGNPADERVDRNVPGPVHDWSGPSPAPESAMLGSRGGPKTRASTGAQSRNSSLGDSLRQVSGGSLADFERGYLCRPLAVAYRRDAYADAPTSGAGCVLRCYPHDWSVHVQGDAGAGRWQYAGSFPSQPTPAQIEQSVVHGLTRAQFAPPSS